MYFLLGVELIDIRVDYTYICVRFWRGAGAVERARLESVCTPKGYRGFESLPLRIGAIVHERLPFLFSMIQQS